jgi:hypothetical protein
MSTAHLSPGREQCGEECGLGAAVDGERPLVARHVSVHIAGVHVVHLQGKEDRSLRLDRKQGLTTMSFLGSCSISL